MQLNHLTPAALSAELGERLKQTRLNVNITQAELAQRAGVSRNIVMNAEKGQAQLENFVALLLALGVAHQLDNFLAKPQLSRERATGSRGGELAEDREHEDTDQW